MLNSEDFTGEKTKKDDNLYPSYLSHVYETLIYDTYKDIQEFFAKRFGVPTIIYVRNAQDKVRPCFPSGDRYQYFCDFCRENRRFFEASSQLSPCVQKEIEYIQEGIKSEDAGHSWKWGWKQCYLGVYDYYAPIRSTEKKGGINSILGVLIVGHWKDDFGDVEKNAEIDRDIGNKVAAAVNEHLNEELSEDKECVTSTLKSLIGTIPAKDSTKRAELQENLNDFISLMEIIATRSLHRGAFEEGDRFVREMQFNLGDVRITDELFRKAIASSLEKIKNYLGFSSAVMFRSGLRDYAHLDLEVVTPRALDVSSSLSVASLNQFREFIEYEGVTLPGGKAGFGWLSPENTLGVLKGIYFASEMVNGHLVIIGFGYKNELKPFERAVLIEAVNEKMLPFITESLSILELDQLMQEVGHLLGRTRAKCATGLDYVKDALESLEFQKVEFATTDAFLSKCQLALEESIDKQHLIRNNFYAFRQVRTNGSDLSKCDKINIAELLHNRVKRVKATLSSIPLSELRFIKKTDEAFVRGVVERLDLVFLNLFDNLCKYAYQGTFATVILETNPEFCVIQFINMGQGVASDEWEYVFKPRIKSRYHDPVKRKEGIGMGLTFCRRVIQGECGGSISLKSEQKERSRAIQYKGENYLTTVTIRLPLVSIPNKEASNANIAF